jgi:hypothetical protein
MKGFLISYLASSASREICEEWHTLLKVELQQFRYGEWVFLPILKEQETSRGIEWIDSAMTSKMKDLR